MTREEANDILFILQAFAEGKVIQMLDDRSIWADLTEREGLPIGTLGESPNIFRIKPEPKYRSFKNAEECWQEMQKHHPFGWVKHLYFFYYIVYVEDGMIGYANASGTILHDNFKDALGSFTFADGTPFGILEEE